MPAKKKASGDPAKGEKIFKNLCAVCHSLSADSVGPALGGIGGSNIASGESFSYSSALSSKATWKWSAANLDRWLANHLHSLQETPWLSPVFPLPRTELT